MTKRIDYFARRGIAKADPQALALRKLRSFLDANEPSLVRFLVNLWHTQGKAITYKELREAILNGDISEEYMEDWRQDYSLLVSETMRPAWEKAIKVAEAEVAAKYPDWNYNPMAEEVSAWTQNHAGEFVTNVTQTQIDGLRAVVRRAATLGDMNVDTLSRVIRPMIGLYEQQAVANMKYYETLIAGGTAEKRALDLSVRYGAQQHRYRGYLVARQELAMAYNTGAHWGTKAAQGAGLLGEMVKVACCADDERVCPICRELDGVIVGMDEGFNVQNRGTYKFTTQYPPFHIGCRCAVLYKEIAPPTIQQNVEA